MLQVGDVIELKEGMKVCASIPEHFIYRNRKGSFVLTHHDVVLGGEFEYLCGKYIVYKTTFDGGGTSHGISGAYPDGHHVFCLKADDENVKIDFYQSGCFTAMKGYSKMVSGRYPESPLTPAVGRLPYSRE
jgi:hypothetical protein